MGRPALTEELEATHGHAIWQRIQEQGLREAARVVDEIVDELAPSSRWTRPRRTSCASMQVRGGLALMLEKQRLVAVEGPVREQFESELRALTDAEQDSKELKSASARCSSTGSSRASSCRSRSAGAADGEARRSRTRVTKA